MASPASRGPNCQLHTRQLIQVFHVTSVPTGTSRAGNCRTYYNALGLSLPEALTMTSKSCKLSSSGTEGLGVQV